MPTKLKSRGNCWLARVVIDGQQVDSKVFPPGRSKGPEWMAAKTWEVERKKEESIAKRMIKYLLFARSHEIWQREIL